MTTVNDAQIAAAVRAECAARRVTQADVQALFGTSLPYVSRRFLGAVPFSAVEIAAIAKRLEVPVARIYERAEEQPRTDARIAGVSS